MYNERYDEECYVKMFKENYEVGDKVYYLNEKKEYQIGTIKSIEKAEINDWNDKDINLYKITGCLYLRSKEHIYGLCV